MAKDKAAEGQAAGEEKDTFLIIHANGKDVFLKKVDSEKAGSFFQSGPVNAFLGSRKVEGGPDELTGAVNLSIGVPDGNGGFTNENGGVLFRKDGANGPFLSGYIGGLDVVPGEKEGVEFTNIKPVQMEGEKMKGTVSVTADIRGPKAEAILAAMPVVERAKADAPDAEKSKKPKM